MHDSDNRYGDWMLTWTGKKFYPLDPDIESIDIRDIAHSLSLQCRYSGHCNDFYSVAQHSVLVSNYLPDEYKLWGLLHDAPEAYLSDVIRPLKPFLRGYSAFEQRVMSTIAERYGLNYIHGSGDIPSIVKEVDNKILRDEFDQLMNNMYNYEMNIPDVGLGIKIEPMSPKEAKIYFLTTFNELIQ